MTEREAIRHYLVAKVRVGVFLDLEALGRAAAEFVGERLKRVLKERGEANVVFATGSSQYAFLASLRQVQDVDWSQVSAFHLDEYLDLSAEHPASFRYYLRRHLFDHLPFGAVHFLNGNAPDLEGECARYAELLKTKHLDLACIGIGENGHLAFNDPPADFETDKLVQIVTLDRAARQQQVNEGHFPALADVPTQALSLSIPAILAAKTLSCVVPDLRKAEAVSCALTAPISPQCPASVLRQHDDCQLFLDVASASQLPLKRA